MPCYEGPGVHQDNQVIKGLPCINTSLVVLVITVNVIDCCCSQQPSCCCYMYPVFVDNHVTSHISNTTFIAIAGTANLLMAVSSKLCSLCSQPE